MFTIVLGGFTISATSYMDDPKHMAFTSTLMESNIDFLAVKPLR